MKEDQAWVVMMYQWDDMTPTRPDHLHAEIFDTEDEAREDAKAIARSGRTAIVFEASRFSP